MYKHICFPTWCFYGGNGMKKIVSIVLALCLTVALAVPAFGAINVDNGDVSFAVASDLHYNVPEEELEWYSEDPIYGYANRRAAMENESGLIIDEFLNQCAVDDNVQFVLISGDLADNGRSIPEEHFAVAEKLAKFEKDTGKQVYVIPGNHDFGNLGEYCEVDIERFVDIYADFGYNQALTRVEGTGSYTADLGGKYRLIALDSNDPDRSTEDGMTEERVQWVIDEAKKAKDDGKYPILMMHHNLLDHLPVQRVLSHDFIIRNHEVTAERWANAGIKLVFSGHEHCSDATSKTSALGNVITDFATTSLTMYPLQYRYFEITDTTICYDVRTVDSIDTDTLQKNVKGYSKEQIDAMNNGLNAFAKQFLKNGIEYRLELGFTDEKLGIKPGDIYYDVVRAVIDELTVALNDPLYGEGGIQERAAAEGIEIPDSDYVDGWDVATDLVAAHYAGSENYPLSERDVKILFTTLAYIIRCELATLEDQTVVYDWIEAVVLATSGSLGGDEILNSTFPDGQVTPAEYFALALLSPLLQSFTVDDEVDDNTGYIGGYGNSNNLENFGAGIFIGFSDFIERIMIIFDYILKAFGAFVVV